MHLIMQQHLQQVAEHTNTPTSSRRVAPTQQGSSLPINTLGPTFSTTCRLPATTHCPAQPAHPQQPHTARAPAGRHPPTGSWPFSPLNGHPPPLHRASPQPRVHAGSAELSSAPRSCSLGRKAPHLGRNSAHGEFAIWRRSHSPAPSTCSTATHRSIKLVAPGAR